MTGRFLAQQTVSPPLEELRI